MSDARRCSVVGQRLRCIFNRVPGEDTCAGHRHYPEQPDIDMAAIAEREKMLGPRKWAIECGAIAMPRKARAL